MINLCRPNPTVDYFDDLDYLKDFKNKFPAIVYNDGLTSKSDLEIKPLVCSERIDEFNLINEASLSEYDEEIVLRFNDLFNIVHPNDSKSEKDNDDNDIDMAPLPAVDKRHHWLRYQIEEYSEGIRHSYKQRLETIWSRPVNRIFAPLLASDHKAHMLRISDSVVYMRGLEHNRKRQDLAVEVEERYIPVGTSRLCVSHALEGGCMGTEGPYFESLFWIPENLMSDTEMGLDVADTMCFQLGGVRRRMT
ncbi:hypothetical protein Tco_0432855 [Tanacetum coccineum]